MPATPAKRVTRSRAAATKTADVMDAPPKRIAAAKSATSRRTKTTEEGPANVEQMAEPIKLKRTAATAPSLLNTLPATRRRLKVTPLDAPAAEHRQAPEKPAEQQAAKKTKSNPKAKKERKAEVEEPEEHDDLDGNKQVVITKTRGKAAVPKDKAEGKQPAAKTRGRPKKTATAEATEPAVSVRQARTRAGSGAAGTQPTAASAAKITAPPRKKVTFQDMPESDKENQPIDAKKTASKAQGMSAAAGLRAKPVRKPATSTGRKPNKKIDKIESQLPKPTPLSPKKVTQVAKSVSPGSSDDDELSGAKTPVRDLSQSPKRSADLAAALSPVKKLDFGTVLLTRSPEKAAPSSNLLSPARRPAAIPFKDALKDSPKRGDGTIVFPPSSQISTATVMTTSASHSQSTLLQSPKRGALDSSIFTQSTIKTAKSPTKTSLLQSPAKRLAFLKTNSAFATPGKVTDTQDVSDETLLDNESHDTAMSCHFRASHSPERSVKVHKVSPEELALEIRAGLDFDESVLDVRSPMKIAKSDQTSLGRMHEEVEPLSIIPNDLGITGPQPHEPYALHSVENDNLVHDTCEPMEGIQLSDTVAPALTQSSSIVPPYSSAMGSFLFRAAHQIQDDEDSSEDELQAETLSTRTTVTSTPGLHSKSTRSRLSTVNPADTSRNVGFTPLAAQLSSWLASSPDKALRKNSEPQVLFSPLATQHVPGEVQVSRKSTPHRASSGSRMSMAPTGSTGRSRPTPARTFSDLLSAATPENPSFFTDQMMMQDFEEHEQNSPESYRGSDDLRQEFVEDVESSTAAEAVQDATADVPSVNMMDVSNLEESFDEEKSQSGVQDPSIEDFTKNMLNEDVTVLANITEALQTSPTVPGTPLSEDHADHIQGPVFYEDLDESHGTLEPGLENEDQGAMAVDEAPITTPSPKDRAATPLRSNISLPHFANTVVSKVPLRPEGYISPIKVSRKRSRSLSAGPSAKKPVLAPRYIPRSNTVISLSPQRRHKPPTPETPGQQSFLVDDFGDSTLDGIEVDEDDENLPPPTPFAAIRSTVATPTRSPLKTVGKGVLQGAVVFVDVHTTEGADASSIFVELLTQMGARCVKQWTWNPRASVAGGEADADNTPAAHASKVGITHVVYKDGGKRTAEKVRDAGGVVWCVGVGWVLDCEREEKWLPESQYAVDTSILPRGGSRRRKSMEPRALINMNGSLSAAKGMRSFSAEMTPSARAELVATPVKTSASRSETNEAQSVNADDDDDDSTISSLDSRFSTPTGVQATTFAASTMSNPGAVMATPTGQVDYDPSDAMSPTTPYYISQGAKLMQQTCPPKQTQQGLFDREEGGSSGFPVTGRIEDQPDESVRARLEAARRRTMNWRPRVASPLGR